MQGNELSMTGNILATYYKGLTRQLRAEVDFINSLFQHSGVKGAGNEAAIRALIEKFIPGRFGVGTGVLLDRRGNASLQCDIVVYDRTLYPSLLSMTSTHLFPVDLVYAVIEVKTTLTKQTAGQALANIKSVRSLDIIPDSYMQWECRPASSESGVGSALSAVSHTPTPPLGAVFAFNSTTQSFDTFKKWFALDNEETAAAAPEIIGCLDQGIVRPRIPVEGSSPAARACAVVIDEPITVSLDKTTGTASWNGDTYPVKKVNGSQVLIDQSKTLLFFLLLLSELLASKPMNPNMRFTQHYLGDLAK